MRDLYQNLARLLLKVEVFGKLRKLRGHPADLVNLSVLQKTLLLGQKVEQAQETSLVKNLYPSVATANTDISN